uniref:Uncharacterized protein n=1 Tax=Xiphophorus couchianus TaxID=32473 RepID=A0A3B5L994_9TELE
RDRLNKNLLAYFFFTVWFPIFNVTLQHYKCDFLVFFLAGCMLCFGQSAFFRFNHPEEAFRMKSMIPHGGGVRTGSYALCPDTESLVNGNHQASSSQSPSAPGERVQSEHSAIVSSIEKDLQEIMDSLVMDDLEPSSSDAKKPPGGQSMHHSPLSPMVNGGGRYLLSPPTSPGAMSLL